MRHNSRLKRGVATVVLAAFLSSCATAKPPRVEAPAPLPPPPPALVPPVATPPAPAPLPPMSVGPRTDLPAEEPRATTITPTPPPPPAPSAPPTAPPVPAAQRGRFIVLNFDNADIETVIHAASEIIGFNYVLGPGVSGKKVTVQTSGRIPQEDVFGVLLAILEVHGVTAVRAGNLYKIVPVEGARERAVPTIVGGTADSNRTADEIVTQIIPIRFAGVNELGTLLRPLISSRGTLIANRETGILIITDSASNISRLLDIIKLVDVEVALDELQIVPLQYAEASEMATILNQLFQAGRLRAGTGGGPSGSGVGSAPAGALPPPVAGAPAGAPGGGGSVGGGSDRPPLIVPERRSNSLIVHARKGEVETIRKVIDKIDVNTSGGRRVFIYYAENAKAKDLGATLNAIYTGRETTATSSSLTSTGGSQVGRQAGQPPPPLPPPPSMGPGGPLGTADAPLAEGQVRFIADETTNAIIVTTTPRQWMDIEATIKQLDRMPRQVLIEVLVAEIALTNDLRLGVDWALKSGSFRFGQSSLNSGAQGDTTPPSFSLTPSVGRLVPLAGGGLTAFVFSAGEFLALLNTLAAENRVNIVSNPHVMTSENKKAVINVSQSVPVVTGQQTGTSLTSTTTDGTITNPSTTTPIGSLNQTVEYRDAGVILTVTPRIGERGTVALDVKQEVNAVGPPVAPTGSPSFSKREAETSVVLLNNQTLVLGGLIQDKVTLNDRGIPFFKNIPLIGFMFGFKERAVERTELLMLITPKVVGTALDAARITNEMRNATQELNNAINSAPLRPRSGLPSTILPMPTPVPAPVPGAPAEPPTINVPLGVSPGPPPVTPAPTPPAVPAPVPQSAPPPPAPQAVPAPPPPALPAPTPPGPRSSVTPPDPAATAAPGADPPPGTQVQPTRPVPRSARPRLVPPPAPAPEQGQPPTTPPPATPAPTN